RTVTCPGAEVERTRGRRRQSVQRPLVDCEMAGGTDLVPVRRERVELAAHRATKQAPEARTCDDGVRRQPRELAADRNAVHIASRWIRTSCPWCAPNISAALPPLIAIATFRYASSYRMMSPGRASAKVRAATT